MIALVTIIYISLIILIYKILKIRPTPKNVSAMVVLGIFLVGSIVILWKFSSPSTNNLFVSRYTVQLVPQVRGPVEKLHAQPNVPLRKDVDLLYEIQKDTYENTVEQITQSLNAAERNIAQLEAGGIAADAAVRKADANRAAAQKELDVARKTAELNSDAISELTVQQLTQQFNAADAAVDQAKATAVQAKIGKQAAESTARSLRAQLANAEFNLEQCTVYAPSDGFVTNWMVREGTMAVPLPLTQLGTFIDTTDVFLVATFPQNVVKHVKEGDVAEFSFKTNPGEVFTGKVEAVIQASGEGQLAVTGQLPSAASLGSQGMFAVRFQLDDIETANRLAIGTAGTAVIYTEKGRPFHVISKVVVRMNAWIYYLNPF